MSRRVLAALLAACALSACTGAGPGGRPSPKSQPPKGVPEHVKIPKVRSQLAVDQVTPCLQDQQVTGTIYTSLGPVGYAASQVKSIRELDFQIPSLVDLVGNKDFATEFAHQPAARRSEDFVTRRVAWAMGLTPHGLDADYFLQGEGSDLIAGFYDPRDQRIVVRTKGDYDDELVTLAHELTHAATDELFGIPLDNRGRLIDDERLAETAVTEGDATLVAAQYLSRVAPVASMRRYVKASLSYEGQYKPQRRAGIPHMVVDHFSWPYQWGFAFVCKVYRERGWAGVNRMYDHPPLSSAEIMFPKRYLSGQIPETPPALGLLNRPWRRSAQASIGAAHLKALFEAPGDVGKRALTNPLGRASAWDGGHYELWVNADSDDEAMGVALVERRSSHDVLCASMHSWYRKAFFDAEAEAIADRTVAYKDENQTAFISCSGRNVIVGIGPDLATAQAVAGYGG
jgi:hypothetical protein